MRQPISDVAVQQLKAFLADPTLQRCSAATRTSPRRAAKTAAGFTGPLTPDQDILVAKHDQRSVTMGHVVPFALLVPVVGAAITAAVVFNRVSERIRIRPRRSSWSRPR